MTEDSSGRAFALTLFVGGLLGVPAVIGLEAAGVVDLTASLPLLLAALFPIGALSMEGEP